MDYWNSVMCVHTLCDVEAVSISMLNNPLYYSYTPFIYTPIEKHEETQIFS